MEIDTQYNEGGWNDDNAIPEVVEPAGVPEEVGDPIGDTVANISYTTGLEPRESLEMYLSNYKSLQAMDRLEGDGNMTAKETNAMINNTYKEADMTPTSKGVSAPDKAMYEANTRKVKKSQANMRAKMGAYELFGTNINNVPEEHKKLLIEKITGGRSLEGAVKELQGFLGVESDGLLGKDTLGALNLKEGPDSVSDKGWEFYKPMKGAAPKPFDMGQYTEGNIRKYASKFTNVDSQAKDLDPKVMSNLVQINETIRDVVGIDPALVGNRRDASVSVNKMLKNKGDGYSKVYQPLIREYNNTTDPTKKKQIKEKLLAMNTERSAHVRGTAVDFSQKEMTKPQMRKAARELNRLGYKVIIENSGESFHVEWK